MDAAEKKADQNHEKIFDWTYFNTSPLVSAATEHFIGVTMSYPQALKNVSASCRTQENISCVYMFLRFLGRATCLRGNPESTWGVLFLFRLKQMAEAKIETCMICIGGFHKIVSSPKLQVYFKPLTHFWNWIRFLYIPFLTCSPVFSLVLSFFSRAAVEGKSEKELTPNPQGVSEPHISGRFV